MGLEVKACSEPVWLPLSRHSMLPRITPFAAADESEVSGRDGAVRSKLPESQVPEPQVPGQQRSVWAPQPQSKTVPGRRSDRGRTREGPSRAGWVGPLGGGRNQVSARSGVVFRRLAWMRPTPRKQAADRYFRLREFESRHPQAVQKRGCPLLRCYRYFGVTVAMIRLACLEGGLSSLPCSSSLASTSSMTFCPSSMWASSRPLNST